MKFVDAHVHLSDKEYAEDIDEIINEAKNSNVAVLVSNYSSGALNSWEKILCVY